MTGCVQRKGNAAQDYIWPPGRAPSPLGPVQGFKPAPQHFSCCRATTASLLLALPPGNHCSGNPAVHMVSQGREATARCCKSVGKRPTYCGAWEASHVAYRPHAKLGTQPEPHSRAEIKRAGHLQHCVIYPSLYATAYMDPVEGFEG